MAKRLFVGNLPYTVANTDLLDMFAKHGKVVSANVIIDKYSGRSKGFGFVEMEDDNEADAAIAAMNGTDIEGRKLTVNVARPMEDRGPRNDGQSASAPAAAPAEPVEEVKEEVAATEEVVEEAPEEEAEESKKK